MIMNKTDGLVWRLNSQLRSLPPGTKLPSLRKLQEEYNVSMTTLNRVISQLKKQKKINVIHGNGIFVAEGHDDDSGLNSVDIIYFGSTNVLNTPGYVKDLIHGLVVEFGNDNISTTVSTLPLTSSLDTAMKTFGKLKFEAVITVFLRDHSFINYFEELKIPHVAITPDIMDIQFNSTYIDNERIMQETFKYLLANGHQKIAYLNSRDKFIFSRDLHQRELFFYRECLRHRLPVGLDMFCNAGYTYDDTRNAIRSLLKSGNEFTAIIVDDHAARAVYDELEANNICPGKDISVIGIDDLEMNRFLRPALTSVRISQHEIAHQSCAMMKKIYANYTEKLESIFIKPELIERQSVKKIN